MWSYVHILWSCFAALMKLSTILKLFRRAPLLPIYVVKLPIALVKLSTILKSCSVVQQSFLLLLLFSCRSSKVVHWYCEVAHPTRLCATQLNYKSSNDRSTWSNGFPIHLHLLLLDEERWRGEVGGSNPVQSSCGRSLPKSSSHQSGHLRPNPWWRCRAWHPSPSLVARPKGVLEVSSHLTSSRRYRALRV
jgi:hypothetical protein